MAKTSPDHPASAREPVDPDALVVPAAASLRRESGRPTGRRRGILLVGCGAVLLPWLVVLAITLPARYGAAHWAVAWVGLDTMEAVGLITTGVLALRGDRRLSSAAAATATLLTVDAWFDIATSVGSDFRVALITALCTEIPLAVLCVRLALIARR